MTLIRLSSAPSSTKPRVIAAADWDEEQEEPVRALSEHEARELKARLPMLSPWRVLGWQAAVGVGVAAVIGGVTASAVIFWSALYGMVVVVAPSLLLARGMTKPVNSAVTATARFMAWEFLKIGASIAMLALAPKVVPALSWPALLVTLAVCIKVNWLALLWRGR